MLRWIRSTDFIVHGRRLLRFYSYYSLFLSLLLIITDAVDTQNILLGGHLPHIFLVASSAYVIVASVFAAIANREPDPQQAVGYVFLEIALLAALMHASGGLETGFSSLILIPLVISNLLAPGVLGYGVAAWTTIAIFYTQHLWPASYDTQELVSSGLYGMLCFVLAWLTQTLSRRLNSALSLASDQATRIRRLQHFSQQALTDLPAGIIACDKDNRILFFNRQSLHWFNLKEGSLLPEKLSTDADEFRLTARHEALLIRRIALSGSIEGDYLLQIEDSARIAADAQQFKLASLGRLTASIAHEIRNPLSALRQAAQLLAETPDLNESELQLTHIIEQHCMRINRTIEDILQLSRRRQVIPEAMRLAPWLEHFSEQFRGQNNGTLFQLTVQCSADIAVQFDPDHLQQVLHNLCANGLRYALKNSPDNARLMLVTSQADKRHIQFDVIDNGGGVASEQRAHLFEPFYTTEHAGTGLGLYLCRELCEANQARIQYHPLPNGTCFRLLMKPANVSGKNE
ncbi:sensor histidine kinase [Thalassolituus sp. LLYu03]|uniref:sensor histidine kinase n=1 Tax=Thalassolituus sp. LLYu03 TaxID=3421656 RepID=UPI003D2D41F5